MLNNIIKFLTGFKKERKILRDRISILKSDVDKLEKSLRYEKTVNSNTNFLRTLVKRRDLAIKHRVYPGCETKIAEDEKRALSDFVVREMAHIMYLAENLPEGVPDFNSLEVEVRGNYLSRSEEKIRSY